jgi:hypothetical protein
MNSYSVSAIHDGQRDDILTANYEQAKELADQSNTEVTCPCGAVRPLRTTFQCFYCGIYFCPRCAKDHFGGDGIA